MRWLKGREEVATYTNNVLQEIGRTPEMCRWPVGYEAVRPVFSSAKQIGWIVTISGYCTLSMDFKEKSIVEYSKRIFIGDNYDGRRICNKLMAFKKRLRCSCLAKLR